MPNPGEKKDSELANAGPLVGGETVAILQDGQNVNTTPEEIAALSKAGSLLLAKIENLNLKNAADTPLQWIGDFGAGNTLPLKAVIIPKGGAFGEKGVVAQAATTSFSNGNCPGNGARVYAKLDDDAIGDFIAGNNNGSFSQFTLNDVIPFLQGLGYSANGDNYPLINIGASGTGPSFNGKVLSFYITPMTSATTTLEFDGTYRGNGGKGSFYIAQVPNFNNIFQSGPIGDASFDSFFDEMITQFTNLNYGTTDNRPSLGLSAPPNTGDTFNGYQAKIKDENDASYLTTPLSIAFSGGVSDPPVILITTAEFAGGADATPFTEIYLKYCGENINLHGYTLQQFVSSLITGTNWGYGTISDATLGKPIFKILGDWLASIVTGTLDDFFVDIYIFGDKLPPVIPLP